MLRASTLLTGGESPMRVAFESHTLTEYLDFQPLLDRYDEALLARAREGGLAPDRALVAARLALIDEAVRFLESVARQDYEIMAGDPTTYRAAERYLHLASEAVFDIGTHLIASFGLPRPERYADVMPILREARIVSADTAAALTDLAGFRNLLVHSYARVDRERLHVFCRTRLDDFRRFAADVGRAIEPGPE